MKSPSRRPMAVISTFGVTYLHRQNPYMVAWWSAVFPGFGHLLLNQYLRGTLLTLSEVFINSFAHINEAMIYSFCGQFEKATSVLEPRWAFGYLLSYLIAIWDSYRSCLTQNKLFHLASMENEPLPSLRLFSVEIQYVEQRRPLTAAAYSFLFPGMGQLYNHRFCLAFYAIFWWWVYASLSHAYEALTYLMIGQLSKANQILQPHWLLFMPSVMGGSIYHSYLTTLENNKLFALEQRQHLTGRYRSSEVRLLDGAGAGS